MAQHYLRSNDNYDHEFRLKRLGEDNLGIIWTLKGRAHLNKNISIIDNEEDYEDIMSFEQIKQLMKRNVVSEIPEIPRNFYSAMELASKNAQLLAQSKLSEKTANDKLNEKDEEIRLLKEKAKAAGVNLDA
jgi:hypothetical protein